MSKPKLPAPRLQLRWAESDNPRYQWECHYELVIPLNKYDIRAEQEGPRGGRLPPLKEWVISMKPPTLRGTTLPPCTTVSGERYCDMPYRDGSHAHWDAEVLGNPPVYVIAPDGMAFRDKDRPPRRASQAQENLNG